MGLDMQFQALPDNEDWWDTVLANEGIRQNLSLLPSVMHEAGHLPTTGELGQLATALVAAHPGIEKRNANIDRFWDTFAFLLSEQRREMLADEEVDTTDLGLIAVRGEHAVGWEGEEVCGFQGIPHGFTTAETVAKVANFLDTVSDEQLQATFDPAAMEHAEVYNNPSADELEEVVHTFHALKRFYRQAADHNEGVLVCLD